MVATALPLLLQPHRTGTGDVVAADQPLDAMVRGFAVCDPVAALPDAVLAPLGVKFLGGKAKNVRFAYAHLLNERTALRLVGNGTALDRQDDGSYITYGGSYRLKPSLTLGPSELLEVSQIVSVIEPHATLGVSYVFKSKEAAMNALAYMERRTGKQLRALIDAQPSTTDVWLRQGAGILTCLRAAH